MAITYQAESAISFPVLHDMTGFQFYPVAVTTSATYPDGALTTIGATTTKPFGVIQDVPDTAGQFAAVVISGPTKLVVYAGTINCNDSLGVSANGVGEATTTDNRWSIGRALESTTDGGANEIISATVAVTRY